MACRCAPALDVARRELDALFPGRDKGSDGCCGDTAHAARKSDHNPNSDGYARARDYDEDIVDGIGDRELEGVGLVLLGDSRTKYLIYEGRLLYPDGTVKKYTGPNAHLHHLHHSIHDWAVRDTSPWGIARAFKRPAPTEENDDMPAPIIRWFTDPNGGPAAAYQVWPGSGIGKYLDGPGLKIARSVLVAEDPTPRGPEWAGTVALLDGPRKNV